MAVSSRLAALKNKYTAVAQSGGTQTATGGGQGVGSRLSALSGKYSASDDGVSAISKSADAKYLARKSVSDRQSPNTISTPRTSSGPSEGLKNLLSGRPLSAGMDKTGANALSISPERLLKQKQDKMSSLFTDEETVLDIASGTAAQRAEKAAGLRERLAEGHAAATDYHETFDRLYPNSGAPDIAKGMYEGAKIGVTKQFPASLAGLATGIHETAGTLWNMVNTPGGTEYEDYVSPLRDDALRMKAEADRASAENLAGRGPAGERIIGVSQAAGNMLPSALLGGGLSAAAKGAGALDFLKNASTALVSAGAGGSSYLDAVTQGAGVSDAFAYGMLSGAAEYVSERLFGGNPLVDSEPGLVNRLVGKLSRDGRLLDFLASRPVETLNEGLEEAIVTVMEPVFRRMTWEPDADMATLEEVMDSAIDGVLLAGLMQGGATLADTLSGARHSSRSSFDARDGYDAQEGVDGGEADGAKRMPSEIIHMYTNKSTAVNRGEAAQVVRVLSDNIPALQNELPVANTSALVFQTVSGNTMAEKARKLFEGIKGVVYRSGFGEIEINGRSVKDDLSHGVGPAKAATISAVPSVIQNGKQIDAQQNWKGRGYDGYTFAAPVTMDGEVVYVAAVVRKSNKNRFYLHEVVDSKGNIIKIDGGESANPTSLAAKGDAGTQSLPSISESTIPRGADFVNNDIRHARAVSDGSHSIQTDTLYIRKKNPQGTVSNADVPTAPEHNVRNVPPQGSVNDTIPHSRAGVNVSSFQLSENKDKAPAPPHTPAYGSETGTGYAHNRVPTGAYDSTIPQPGGEVNDIRHARGAFGKNGVAAYMLGRETKSDKVRFFGDFARAYNRGLTGQSYTGPVGGLTDAQAQAAHEAGKSDARLENAAAKEYNIQNNIETEALGNGAAEEIHLRDSGKRVGGAYPSGQISGMEKGSGQNQGRNIQDRSRNGEAAAFTYGEKVSTSSLGIAGGSGRADIRLVKSGDTEATRDAKALAKERGLRLVLFAGNNLTIRQRDGTRVEARGYISGDRVFIRVDHPLYTADQLMRHEAGHDMITKGEINPDDVRQRIEETFGPNKTDRLATLYTDAYAGSNLSAYQIWEEIICDSLGDMNIFAESSLESTAAEMLTEMKKTSAGSKATGTRGPPAAQDGRASIEHDVNNTPYVVVISDILAGVPRSRWVATVKAVLAEKFPDGVHVGSEMIKINRQSRREMTFSQYTQWLANNDASTYADKFRAADDADELILASRNYINEGLKHARKDNIRDFARGTVLLRVGKNDYSAEVVVGTTTGGDMLLYDIVNLQKTQIKEKSRRTIPPTEKSSDRSGTPASETNIVQSGAAVKGKYSLELSVAQGGRTSRETGRRAQRGRSIELETMENNRFERLRQFHGELPSEWYAFTHDNFYIYSNQSFTDYTILMTAKLTERNRADIEAFMEELENGTIGSTEAFDSWAQDFRRGKGRDNWHRVRAGNSGTAGRYDGVDVRARGSEHSGDPAKNGGVDEVKPEFLTEAPEAKFSRETGRRAQRGRSVELETMENNRFQRLRRFGDNLPEIWYAYTEKYLYVYENFSQTDYHVIGKVPVANQALSNAVIEEVRKDVIRTATDFNRRLKDLRSETGRHRGSNDSSENRGTAVADGGLSGNRGGQSSGQNGSAQESGGADQIKTRFSREVELTGEERAELAEMQSAIRETIREELERMGGEYGWIWPGEAPAREVRVPRRTAKNKKVSQTIRTVMEAGATPDEALPDIERLIADGVFSHEAHGDEQAKSDARAVIEKKGFDRALEGWSAEIKKGAVSKANTALGWTLYNEAVNAGDTGTALDILVKMTGHQRAAAQAVQATRILKQLSPDARLYAAARSVEDLQEELTARYGKKAPELKIDEELARSFLGAGTPEARDAALVELYKDIGRQMPSTFADKWTAWRYLAMLANPRTHVRNILGNAGFMPVVATKNLLATGIEAAASRLGGGRLERTKAFTTDKDLIRAAYDDYANVREIIMDGGKYQDSKARGAIDEGRVIFKTKALERARRKNSELMELEDAWFSHPHYAMALAQYAKANGITAGRIASGKGLDEARAYAILEAQKATYRDTNAFSELVSGLGRRRDSDGLSKAAGAVMEGVLPFRKTPANILVRGLEYSPAGLLKGLTHDLYKVRRGEMSGAEAIDNISAGLTGTGLVALGLWAAAEGLIRGAGAGDGDEKEFDKLRGHQTYALELPDGTSITLDWLAPEALPLFVGVNLFEQTHGEMEEFSMASALTAIQKISEPMLQMSCLQSLNDIFDTVGYASGNDADISPLAGALATAATSYLTQGLPTLLGQLERSAQDTRKTTYTGQSRWLTGDMQYTLGKMSAKIPGWDYAQIDYIDAWGRSDASGNALERVFGNMLSPAYLSRVNESEMEKELERLYKATGDASVLPSRPGKKISLGGDEEKQLTGEEYVKYATAKGRAAYGLVGNLMETPEYKRADDLDKAELIGLAYSFCTAWAKTRVSAYQPNGWIQKALDAVQNTGVAPEKYIAAYMAQKDVESLKYAGTDNTISSSSSLLKMELVYSIEGLSDKQRHAMFENFGVGRSVIGYNKAAVKEALGKMRKLSGAA